MRLFRLFVPVASLPFICCSKLENNIVHDVYFVIMMISEMYSFICTGSLLMLITDFNQSININLMS